MALLRCCKYRLAVLKSGSNLGAINRSTLSHLMTEERDTCLEVPREQPTDSQRKILIQIPHTRH